MIQAKSKAHPHPMAQAAGIALLMLTTLAVIILAAAGQARAGAAVYTAGGAAIDGYDAVAYFTDGKPIAGKAEYRHDWMGVTWRFASAEHRDAFAASPEKYAPQYGGFCAWAVSQGYTAKTDPDAWRIEGDKLYLNYSKSVQSTWAQDIPGNVKKADGHWPALKDGLAAK